MSDSNAYELYFDWLRRMVGVTNNPNPRRRYHLLLEQLINTEFRYSNPYDANRVEDGRELRYEFAMDNGFDPAIFDGEVSVLEVLVGLCRRMSFDTDEGVDVWFWTMMVNLDIRNFSDEVYENQASAPNLVQARVDTFLNRSYSANGEGGLFPLRHSETDQRDVELLYQMSAYLLERVF